MKADVTRIVFFDGVCTLCNAAVDFILRNDSAGRFHFASLQSPVWQRLHPQGEAPGLDTLVLWQEGRVYTASTAVLRIAAALRFPWKLLSVFLLVPPFVRDAVYRWVARHRYRWFGKRDTCRMPSPEERARFLDA